MPTTRSSKNIDSFLTLSAVKNVKRKIVHDGSIDVTKRQRRVPLRKKIRRNQEEFNVNNVSISSDHNDDNHEVSDVTVVFDDGNEIQAHKKGPQEMEAHEIGSRDVSDVSIASDDENVIRAHKKGPQELSDAPFTSDDRNEIEAHKIGSRDVSDVTIASDGGNEIKAHKNDTQELSDASFTPELSTDESLASEGLDDSLEIEEVGGDIELDFEEVEEEEIERRCAQQDKNKYRIQDELYRIQYSLAPIIVYGPKQAICEKYS